MVKKSEIKIGEHVVNRRTLLTGAAAVAAVGVGGSLLASCSSNTSDTTTAGAGSDFDPKRSAGATVKVLLVDGERSEKGFKDKLAYVKNTYGINAEVTTLALGALLEKANKELRNEECEYDIIDMLGFMVAGTAGAGLFTKLNPYVEDVTKTPADWDLTDFPTGALNYCGYFDVANQKFGGSDLYLVPGNASSSVMMFYRKDLLEAAGLAVPTTYEDYLAAAKKLNTGGVSGNVMIGGNDVSLILVDWYGRFASMGGQLMSGSPSGKDYKPNLTSDASIRALQNMIDLKAFAPKGVTTFGFTESLDAFASGKVAMMLCWTTIAGSVFNADSSKVADKVAVAPIPGDAGVGPHPIRGGWGLGIPNNLPDARKEAAWTLMTYLTSKELDKHQVGTYQTDPNRKSTFADPELVAALPYLTTAGASAETASVMDIAVIPQCFELIGEAAREFNLALVGSQNAKTACAKAQAAWEKILKREKFLA